MGLIGDGPALCAPPEPPSPQQEQILQEQDENNGQDFTRPQGLFQVRYEYRSATRTGAVEGSTHELISNIVTLRADERIDLIPDWTLALRTDLPMVVKNPITDDNPSGNDEYSIGDVDFQSGITTSFNTRWAAGGGVRIVAPTAGDGLGTGKWRLLWGAGVRYMLPEIGPDSYFVPQVRYDVSFAGDPSRSRIKSLQFQPTLNIGIQNDWFLTLYPNADIRLNYGDPITGQKGRLFLPVDALIGHSVSPRTVISLEVGAPIVRDYPVYNFKTQVSLKVQF